MTATVPAGLNQIDLAWIRGFEGDITVADNYRIQRRVLGESQWTTLASGVRTDRYSDVTPTPGQVYEYRVLRQPESQSPTTVAALRAAPVHHRGKVLLLVDTTLVADVATEVNQWMWDLRGDGWTVTASVVPRHDDSWTSVPQYKADVATVKSLITTSYNSPPTSDPLVVILLGHVTIPFSGITSMEDGHTEHAGAWPADLYYGDMDGTWTDTGSNSQAQPLRNVPDDGKWDQPTVLPVGGVTKLEVAVGRIDFARMPAFTNATYLPQPHGSEAEVERALIKNYLGKARAYRNKNSGYTVTDTWRLYLGFAGEFTHLVDSARSVAANLEGNLAEAYRTTNDVFMTASGYGSSLYLWGIHGGYGQYVSIERKPADRRTSEQLVDLSNEPHVLFYLLCGSYFADWNKESDGFMRACLSTDNYGLATVWAIGTAGVAGPWRMNRLGRGHHLGAMLQETIENRQQSCRAVYILGDPTLRAYVTAPSSSIWRVGSGTPVVLNWTASSEPVDGYYVYRGTSLENALSNGPLAETPVTGTTYTDSGVTNGTYTCVVRAVKSVGTGAGSFQNLSQSASVSISVP